MSFGGPDIPPPPPPPAPPPPTPLAPPRPPAVGDDLLRINEGRRVRGRSLRIDRSIGGVGGGTGLSIPT